jgi:hypothetical protein
MKSHLNGVPLFEARPEDVLPFVNHGLGAKTFLERLIEETPHRAFRTAASIGKMAW